MKCLGDRKRILGFRIEWSLPILMCLVGIMAVGGCGDDSTPSGPTCGDGMAEGVEVCDGDDLRGESCESLGYGSGYLYCHADCMGFDTSNCTSPAVCGDGVIEGNEACDGDNLGGETCESQGFEGGTLLCATDCSGFDTSGCTGVEAECGNDIIEGDEACDGSDLAGETCESMGYDGGTLLCMADCSGFYTGDCTSLPQCGNNTVEEGEVCDGTDLGGQTCVGLGFDGGDLSCRADCSGFDTSKCTSSAVCGDNTAEGGEVCDGTDLKGETCEGLGYDGGTLSCRGDCTGFDTSLCTSSAVCGNDTKELGEVCDGTDLVGKTCQDLGWDAGVLVCRDDCSGFDTSGCTMTQQCGNNVKESGEICDGADLDHETCDSLGYQGGTLACLGDCSGYDESGCFDVPKEWRCNPDFYGAADGCDCGCGAVDPDCNDASVGSCDFCDALGSCGLGECPSNIDPNDNSTCTVPVEWTCSADSYGSGDGCHCGCGALDPDCEDVTVDMCDSCFGDGSCGTGTCPANIEPNNNAICDGPGCGNELVESGEVCDGSNLNNETCQSLGFHGGTLACESNCSGYDTSGCYDLPETWRCNPSFYGDGVFCDCGCGVWDPDCDDESVSACDYCDMSGSCGVGVCDANIDPTQNWTCTVPAEWTCSDSFYGADDGCDCGCGALDPDCPDVTVDVCDYCDGTGSCSNDGCDPINPDDNTTCTLPVCGNGFAEAGEVCDGSDLAAETCETLGYAGGTLACASDCSGFDTSGCEVPSTWRCDSSFFDDGYDCDCGCGAVDPDCEDMTADSCDYCDMSGSCGVASCGSDDSNINPSDNSTCTVPDSWTCSPIFYGAYGCDCGCGALDPACSDVTVDACEYCSSSGSCGTGTCPANIDPADNSVCSDPECGNNSTEEDEVCDGSDLAGQTCSSLGYEGGTLACSADCSAFNTSGCNVPSAWRCSSTFFDANDGCDCGCGALDPDCDDLTVGSCDWCMDWGSCGMGTCPSNIHETDNTTCTVPAEWTCSEIFYGADDGCDCGCGALDPDCESTSVDACDYCNMSGSCGVGPCPTNIDPSDNSTCN